ncbi:MAG: DNA internalization-related competence protein ComEC/Rec2, partial [Methylotenera sp.]
AVRLKRPHGTQNPHVSVRRGKMDSIFPLLTLDPGFDFESWALSENIRATGSIKTKAGLKKLKDFVWKPKYIVEHLREKVQQRINTVFGDKPYSGIIQALVIGDDSQIAADDWQVFLRTGTSHLMSISGIHITMLAGSAFGLTGFIWRRNPKLVMRLPTRKAATLAGAIAALLYTLIAGFSVPSQRTFYMLMVFAIALWSGRQLVITQVLAMALFIVVIIDPWAVSSPGFWLSFGAVAMLGFALGARVGQLHWLKAALQTQWAVTIGMLPLLLVMFNQTSIISPFANAFAIPLISFVVTPLALLGSFLPIDAALNLSYQALNVCMVALKWLNQLPIVTWQQHAPPVWTLLPAMIGVIWLLLPRGFPMRWLGLIGFMPMLLIPPVRPMMGDMKVTVLDVGQGLSVVVQTATHTLLYDTGPTYGAQADAGSRIAVPFLRGAGVKKLDGLIVSHNDNDHSGGMQSVITLMPVAWLASSFSPEVEAVKSMKKISCFAGQRWMWDGVEFEMLHPGFESYRDAILKDNNRSCVVKVTSQAGSVLLTGDIEKEAELELLNRDAAKLNSDIMIAPHHGSKTSSTSDFIAAVAPSVTIFTTGYLNRFGHPKPLIAERYQTFNSLLYRSDYDGALTLDFKASTDANLNSEPNISITSWRTQNRRYWQDSYTE